MVRNLLSGCDGVSRLSIITLNKILVRQSDAFISANNSFEVIEKKAAQKQAAAVKRAWVEDGGAVNL